MATTGEHSFSNFSLRKKKLDRDDKLESFVGATNAPILYLETYKRDFKHLSTMSPGQAYRIITWRVYQEGNLYPPPGERTGHLSGLIFVNLVNDLLQGYIFLAYPLFPLFQQHSQLPLHLFNLYIN